MSHDSTFLMSLYDGNVPIVFLVVTPRPLDGDVASTSAGLSDSLIGDELVETEADQVGIIRYETGLGRLLRRREMEAGLPRPPLDYAAPY